MATHSGLVDRRRSVLAVLLGVAAVACFGDVVASVVRLVDISSTADAIYRVSVAEDAASLVASARTQAVSYGVVALVGVLALAWLVVATRRRAPGSRGGVWVVTAVLSAAVLFEAAIDPGGGTPDPRDPALRAAFEELALGWYTPVHSLVAGIAVIGLIAAAVTMSRISAMDYYH